MKTDCPFLEHRRYPQAGGTSRCGVGINFYAVGQGCGLCQACSISSMGRLPDCRHLDAYAWLEGYPGGAPFVKVELFCGLTGDPLPSLLPCAGCLERRLQPASLSRPLLAPMLAGQQLGEVNLRYCELLADARDRDGSAVGYCVVELSGAYNEHIKVRAVLARVK